MVILFLIFLIFIFYVVFDIPWYAILLGAVGLIAVVTFVMILVNKIHQKIAANVINARLIEEIAVYKRKSQCSGILSAFMKDISIIHTSTFWTITNVCSR